jgi:hypothetical protein
LECRTENISFISVLKKPEPKFITVPSVQLVRFRFSVILVRFLGSGSFCPGLTTAATVEPTSTRRCVEATTPGVGDATTAGRTGALRPNHPVHRLSAGPYDGRRSRPGSEPRLPSPSTRGRQGRNYGSRTTGWHASWVERTMTTSSSATSPCSSLTPPEPGWSICLLRRSPTGTTWSKPSPATSRAHTCALGTPGISEDVASSRENPCGTTSGDF